MAILIVDNDWLTRNVLRSFATRLGISSIREAKNSAEAKEIIQSDRGIGFVICDQGRPDTEWLRLLEAVACRPDLTGMPFLLTASDGFRFLTRRARQSGYSRLDGVLLKPFGLPALATAMTRAHVHRMRHRTQLLYAGERERMLDDLRRALPKVRSGQWGGILSARTIEEIDEHLKVRGTEIGGILVDPALTSRIGDAWLRRYRTSPAGRAAVAVCLSRDPKAAFPLHRPCQFFVDAPVTAGAWLTLLDAMAARIDVSWDLARLTSLFRGARARHDLAAMKRAAHAMRKLRADTSEADCALGELEINLEKRREALAHFRSAAGRNPFYPRAYLKWLELIDVRSPYGESERRKVANIALEHCRRHAETRSRISQFLEPEAKPC